MSVFVSSTDPSCPATHTEERREREPCFRGCQIIYKYILYFDNQVSVSFWYIHSLPLPLHPGHFPMICLPQHWPCQLSYASYSAQPLAVTPGISAEASGASVAWISIQAANLFSECFFGPRCKEEKQLEVLQVSCSKSNLAHQKPNSQASHALICSSPAKLPQLNVRYSHPVIVQAETPGQSYWGPLSLMLTGSSGKHSLVLSIQLKPYSRLPIPELGFPVTSFIMSKQGQMFKIIFWNITINLPIEITNWPFQGTPKQDTVAVGLCPYLGFFPFSPSLYSSSSWDQSPPLYPFPLPLLADSLGLSFYRSSMVTFLCSRCCSQ